MGYDVGAADPRAFATAWRTHISLQFGTRGAGLRGAGRLVVGGGCGDSSGGIAQETPGLVDSWKDPGGLHTAATTEEAEIEEETSPGRLNINISSGGGANCSGVLGYSRS